jgi:hypothetical protein
MMIPSGDIKRFVEALAKRDGHTAIRPETVRGAIAGWARCYAIVHHTEPSLSERRLNAALKYYMNIRAHRYRQPELLSA